ncbi:hypothetical protein BGW39_006024 [Mortierella sp. 14UC]|nr:hypothetical protein BGW39_006024 [Mortierella sp. 14UC]
MNEQSGSVVLADVIAEFQLFESTQKYSCPIKTARHPGLKTYISQIVHTIRAELVKDTIHRICVVTLNPSTKPIDRFVFEMSVLKAFEERFQIAQHQSSPHTKDDTHQPRDSDAEYHQIQQAETTNMQRLDKGKGKAAEYQYHQQQDIAEDNEDVDADLDADVDVEAVFETDNYEGYGGDHEQEQGELEHGNEREDRFDDAGGGEEEYDGGEEDEDGEPPLVRRSHAQDITASNATATTADAAPWATAAHVAERSHYNSPARGGGDGNGRQAPHFGARVDLTTDLEMMLRAMLLKISICDAHLAPLQPESSFTVLVEMKNKGAGPEAKPDFPWSPISPVSHQEQLKVSAPTARPSLQRKIIPVKTVDVADIQLELYLEKFDN